MLPDQTVQIELPNAAHEVARLILNRRHAECENVYEVIRVQYLELYQGSSATLPSSEIIGKRMHQYAQAYEQAEDALKQEMLFEAALASFRPEFYATGESKILWDKLIELEPRDVAFLREVIAKTDPEKARIINMYKDFGQASRAQIVIAKADPEAEFADRLEVVGLVDTEPTEIGPGLKVSWKGMAKRLVALTSIKTSRIQLGQDDQKNQGTTEARQTRLNSAFRSMLAEAIIRADDDSDNQGVYFCHNIKELAEEVGLEVEHVREYVEELKADGIARRIEGKHTTDQFVLDNVKAKWWRTRLAL